MLLAVSIPSNYYAVRPRIVRSNMGTGWNLLRDFFFCNCGRRDFGMASLYNRFLRHSYIEHRPKSYLRPSRRLLCCESLEDRRLMANLSLGVQLWTVGANDVPATKIVANPANPLSFKVANGTAFFVQVLADDTVGLDANRSSQGIVSLPLDLTWQPATAGRIEYTGVIPSLFNQRIASNNPILTQRFAQVRFVNDFFAGSDSVPAGKAVQLRGATLGDGIGKACSPSQQYNTCNEFSLMKFQAKSPGTATFNAKLNGSMAFADGVQLDNLPEITATIEITEADSNLSGFVFADANQDSQRTLAASGAPLEIGLPNVTISLFLVGATTATATTSTGPDGWYHFEKIQPGVYRIVESQPAGFRSTGNALGRILPTNLASGIAGIDQFDNISIAAGEQGVNYNFGEVLLASSINKRVLLGSTPIMDVLVAQRLGVASTAILGTDGNDAIAINNTGNAIQVTVNSGPMQSFNVASIKSLVLDAGAGEDTVTVSGSTNSELGHFQPTYLALSREDLPLVSPLGYGLVAKNAEHVVFSSNSNQADLAVFEDSTGSDVAAINGSNASVAWANNLATSQSQSFSKVRLIKTQGGSDSVNEQAHDFVLERLGNWL